MGSEKTDNQEIIAANKQLCNITTSIAVFTVDFACQKAVALATGYTDCESAISEANSFLTVARCSILLNPPCVF
uniref:Uncharacterized protein n=1 Tax=Meloidogyne incognita TaxID=6306 RepID=A0A914NMR1_MELIC